MRHFKNAFRDSLPVMAGYVVLAIGYGIMMSDRGYGLLAPLSSLLIFAGSMQYASVSLLCGGASLLTLILTTLAVNLRHLFYGISMAQPYRQAGRCKPYLIFGLTDETYSIVCSGDKPMAYCFWVTLLNQCYWVAGTVIGVLLGPVLPFNTDGIDFSLTALFLVVMLSQWLATDAEAAKALKGGVRLSEGWAKRHFPALVGTLVTAVCRLIFGPESFLIPSMGAILLILLLYLRKEEAHHDTI